jgi:hypothetical protein
MMSRAELTPRERAQLSQLSGDIQRINGAAQQAQAAMSGFLRHAIVAGELLAELKSRVERGCWLKLFAIGTFAFSERTAQRYMQLHRRHLELKEWVNREGHGNDHKLTMTKALALLAEPINDPCDSRGPKHRPNQDQFGDESRAVVAPGPPTSPVGAGIESCDGELGTAQDASAASVPDVCGEVPDALPPPSADQRAIPSHIVAAVDQLRGSVDSPRARYGEYRPNFVLLDLTAEPADKAIEKLLHDYHTEGFREAVVLLPARTDRECFRKLSPFMRVFLARLDTTASLPDQPLAVVYLGKRQRAFAEVFGLWGDVYVSYGSCHD